MSWNSVTLHVIAAEYVINLFLREKMQRRAARFVTRINESDKALERLKWPTLQCRRDNHVY